MDEHELGFCTFVKETVPKALANYNAEYTAFSGTLKGKFYRWESRSIGIAPPFRAVNKVVQFLDFSLLFFFSISVRGIVG